MYNKRNTKRSRSNVDTLERVLDWLEPFFIHFFNVLFFIITLPFRIVKSFFNFVRRHRVFAVGAVLCASLFFIFFTGACDGSWKAFAFPDNSDNLFAAAELFEETTSTNYSEEAKFASEEETPIVTETANPVIDELATDAVSADDLVIEDSGTPTELATDNESSVVILEENAVEDSSEAADHSSPLFEGVVDESDSIGDQIYSGDTPLIEDTHTTVTYPPATFETISEDVPVITAAPDETVTLADVDASYEEIEDEPADLSWTNDEISRIAADMGYYSDLAPIAMAGMRLLVDEYGFTREGAAGLMGNAFAECTYFVGADNGSHFGIFQWDYNDRWPRISKYLEETGCIRTSRYDNYYDLSSDQQIDVFLCQLRASLESSDAQYYTSTIEYCRTASDPSSAADNWRVYYEGCGDQATQSRRDAAVRALDLYNVLY